MSIEKRYYIYGLFRPTGIVCYIGKGKGSRFRAHFRRTHNLHLRAIIAQAGGELPVVIIRSDLTETEAFEIERALITAIGRECDGGPLVNLTEGGIGGRGRRQSEEERAKRKAIMSNPEVTARMSAAHLGKTPTEETVAKMGAAQVLRWKSREKREAQRLIQFMLIRLPHTNADSH